MVFDNQCPICKASYYRTDDECIFCANCNYKIHNGVLTQFKTIEQKKRANNSIFSWIVKHIDFISKQKYQFYYYDPLLNAEILNPNIEEKANMINVYNLLKAYPKTLLQRIDEILINIVSIYNDMGEFFSISSKDESLMLCESNNIDSELNYLIQMMTRLEYIISEEDSLDDSIYRCQVTLAGWKHIEEINAIQKNTNQAFIAMKFSVETEYIAEAFKKAILSVGYIPYKMDEIEHNNQIIPEMFYEISRSKMLVIDVTIPNLGAYYEAGYAQALGKEVIVCCKKENIQNAHFDISQKNMIVWKTEDELIWKLARRIEATVGKINCE